MAAYRRVYDSHHLQADCKDRHQLRNPTLGNRVWATFTLFNGRQEKLKQGTRDEKNFEKGMKEQGVEKHEQGKDNSDRNWRQMMGNDRQINARKERKGRNTQVY